MRRIIIECYDMNIQSQKMYYNPEARLDSDSFTIHTMLVSDLLIGR